MASNLDLILKGNVITVSNQRPRAEAIGIKNGKIVAVGSVTEVDKRAGKSTEILDLKGKTILPGFIDSHAHPMGTGRNRTGVDLSAVTSISEALAKIKQKVQETPSGKWILCPEYNRLHVAEKRFPTRKELDKVSMKHPIWVQHYDGHFSMLNSLAFKILKLSADMEGVETNANGEPTGLIQDPASGIPMRLVDSLFGDDDRLNWLAIFAQEALAAGLTTVFTKESLESANFILENKARYPIRFRPMIMRGGPLDDETLDKITHNRLLGNKICLANVADGSLEGHTGALYEPYTNAPETLGMLYFSDDEIYKFVEKAHKAGLQISIHAESDRSIEQVLWAYEKVLAKYPRQDHRHRIEHFEVPTMRLIKHAARLGVALGMQPMFITVCEGPNLDYYRTLLGDERVKRSHPFRSILDEGILVSGGSDTPVTRMNPLGGIHACVNHPTKEQRIDVYEAIEIFTINGAKIGFEEDLKGSIEEGKLADFVVLSDDPYRVPREQIANIKVEMTIVGGKIAYET